MSEKTNCNQFKKLSAKYIKYNTKILKEKSKILKKNTLSNIQNTKNQFIETNFYNKLLKFKQSKTHKEFSENNYVL